MQPRGQVLVELPDGTTVQGLLLKWGRDEKAALVTYELDGRVATTWIPLERVLPIEVPD
ncbi:MULTISPECIES: hypothetical protein [Nocardioides]|uniref:DUF4926 domain-containing protein n=1 Tax=Nocardioides vastitatis TaxID=2568655 RepID=A0ABW0ZCZ3_9ACTN|nr:hypothetical protein [Nocardioides sp.]